MSPALFRRCPRLTHFGVRYAPGVTGRTLFELQHLPLVGVGFESTGLDDGGFQALAEIPALNYFNVDRTRITGDSLKRLEGRRDGITLIANGTGITPEAAGNFAARHHGARMFVDKEGDASYHFAEGRLAHRIPARGSPGYKEIDGK